MDSVTILRDLWRLRQAVVVVALFALIVGFATMYKVAVPGKIESRRYEVGVATARILVDTPSSQVVEVAPKGSDSLGVRANLLASLMVDGVVKAAIAHRAGLPPKRLIGITEADSEPASVAVTPTRRDFVLKTRVVTNAGGDQLPIIEISAQAPDRVAAARLGGAAVEGLRDYLDSRAARERIADVDRLQVTGLGAPQAVVEARGPSPLFAIVVAIGVFLLGCAGLISVLALTRSWLAASLEDEELAKEAALYSVVDRHDDADRHDDDDDWLEAERTPPVAVPSSDDAPTVQRRQRRAGTR